MLLNNNIIFTISQWQRKSAFGGRISLEKRDS